MSDHQLIAHSRLRQFAYDYGGFWPGLLRDWQPNFRGQTVAMFISYAFLHGGVAHLIFNMVTLWSLGASVARLTGVFGMTIIYGGAILGGAGAYGILSVSYVPMVGASGALFGLAGALVALDYESRLRDRRTLFPVLQMGFLLIAINIVMYWALDGQLAWQTHLGGGLSGWAIARIIGQRSVT